jgi:hypothetical protein
MVPLPGSLPLLFVKHPFRVLEDGTRIENTRICNICHGRLYRSCITPSPLLSLPQPQPLIHTLTPSQPQPLTPNSKAQTEASMFFLCLFLVFLLIFTNTTYRTRKKQFNQKGITAKGAGQNGNYFNCNGNLQLSLFFFQTKLKRNKTSTSVYHSLESIPTNMYGIYRAVDWVKGCLARSCGDTTEGIPANICAGHLTFVSMRREGLFDSLQALCETCHNKVYFSPGKIFFGGFHVCAIHVVNARGNTVECFPPCKYAWNKTWNVSGNININTI